MWNRRHFLCASAAALAADGVGLRIGALAALATRQVFNPSGALDSLIAGNVRFVSGASIHGQHVSRRDALAAGQSPYAMILTCSDSRVAPEIVFDQSLGDLFVVRVAGNFADADGTGSIQYAIEHFASPVLLVLGHTSCGAIHATVDNLKAGSPPVPGNIADIVKALTPAARAVMNKPGDAYLNATKENVRENVARLKGTATIIAPAVKAGKLSVVGGVYNLQTGTVSLL